MQIELPRLDPPIEYADVEPDLVRWLANLVDLLNQALTQLEESVDNIIAAQSADIGGGGAGPIVVSVPGLTAGSVVTASVVSSSNPVSIIAVVAGTDQFSVTFSANPGASAIINYVAFIAPA